MLRVSPIQYIAILTLAKDIDAYYKTHHRIGMGLIWTLEGEELFHAGLCDITGAKIPFAYLGTIDVIVDEENHRWHPLP